MPSDVPAKPRLLDQVRAAIRARMREPEITRFVSWLASDRKVSASTQNQALSALLFLYRHVLAIALASLPVFRGRWCRPVCPS